MIIKFLEDLLHWNEEEEVLDAEYEPFRDQLSLAGSARKSYGKWTRMTGWLPWSWQTLTPTISYISPAERKVMCSRSVVDKMDVEMAMENSTRLRWIRIRT